MRSRCSWKIRSGRKAFYERVFDLPVLFEDEASAAFRFDKMIVNLLKLSAAHDLIGPGTVASPESGSRFQLTIGVDDEDAVCAELASRGVTLLNGPVNREWGMRTASFTRSRRPYLGGRTETA